MGPSVMVLYSPWGEIEVKKIGSSLVPVSPPRADVIISATLLDLELTPSWKANRKYPHHAGSDNYTQNRTLPSLHRKLDMTEKSPNSGFEQRQFITMGSVCGQAVWRVDLIVVEIGPHW